MSSDVLNVFIDRLAGFPDDGILFADLGAVDVDHALLELYFVCASPERMSMTMVCRSSHRNGSERTGGD